MDKYLSKDTELLEFLDSLPKHHTKVIFTNAREEQAQEALECLGVAEHFEVSERPPRATDSFVRSR